MKSNLIQLLFVSMLIVSCGRNSTHDTIDISKNWHFSPDENNKGTSEKWYTESFNDSNWNRIDGGKSWEVQGYPNLDSFGWYRKTVEIPADWEGKDVWIKFGGVNDAYKLFINGLKVGTFGEEGKSVAGKPTFTKLSDKLNFGKTNQITVKVNDWKGSGGLWHFPIILTTDKNNVSNTPTIKITAGDLQAVFADNNAYGDEHQSGYNGIAELIHTAQSSNIFVPSCAGFNLEHIFAGDSLEQLFEPRIFPMKLKQISKNSVELHQTETPLSHVESWTTFKVVPPHYIDVNFRCIIKSNAFFKHGYAGFFWASYFNAPKDKKIYFLGKEKGADKKKWIGYNSSKHGVASTHIGVHDNFNLFAVPEFNLILANHYSNYLFAEPFYYGKYEDMVFAYLFSTPKDGMIRFTQSDTGAGPENPAWDFQFLIPNPKQGKEYSFNARLVYKPFISSEDILDEYNSWKMNEVESKLSNFILKSK